jgi:hypothetical protein
MLHALVGKKPEVKAAGRLTERSSESAEILTP